jgi:NitT/TauT family transport system ATP-binding protein
MIALQNVCMDFETRAGPLRALANINLTVNDGEFVTIIGPSGCGKSTILRLVAGLVLPTEGHIKIGDQTATQARLARRFGFVFQSSVMLPWRTAMQNLTLPLEIIGLKENDIPIPPTRLLEIVGLANAGALYPRQLSGGMRQRVAIARALSFNPPILLMDEPFGALDALTRDRLQALTVDIWERSHKTVLFVTHDVYEAVYLSDRIVILSPSPGTVQEIVNIELPRPRSDSTKEHVEYIQTAQRILKIIKH